MALTAGTRLGHYEIVSPLGAGGMGEVYRALDRRLHRHVAIKVLPPDVSSNPAARRRFEQEARAVAALAHPNILAIHYFDTHQDNHYAVTELLEGETLRERIVSSGLPWTNAAQIGASIADGLAAAHGKGIIHRDLKPANIFLTADGEVKILDFGLARVTAGKSSSAESATDLKTAPNTVMGTVGYMSPEQLRGQPVDATTDIFALGCILHEMIGGRHPFARASATATMAAVLSDEPPDLPPGAAPASLLRLIRRCLTKNPLERFQSARDLAFDLRAMLTEGQAPQSAQLRPMKPTPGIGRRAMIVAAVLLVGVVSATIMVSSRRIALTPPEEVRSILVVPFENATGDPEAEYLSDGIAEGLINTLSKLPDFRVVARTTAFQYKGKPLDLQSVRRQLGVDAVLSGRLASHTDKLTIQADLLDTGYGTQLWGDRFHQENRDLLKIEQEIVSRISQALRIRVTPAEQGRISRPSTDNPEAYKLYLQGRFHWAKRKPEAIKRARDLFEQAVAIDPQFALAYTGLADAYNMLASNRLEAPENSRTRSEDAVRTALRLDPNLAEAHASLGLLEMNKYHYAAAERAFDRAMELNPNYANTLLWYSILLLARGHMDESFSMIRTAEQLDPLSVVILSNVAQRLNIDGDYAGALEKTKQAQEVDPVYIETYGQMALAYEGLGQPAKAAEVYRQAADLATAPGRREYTLARAHAMLGELDEAKRLARILEERARDGEVVNTIVGFAYAGVGDRDKAFEWLNRAFEAREPGLRNQFRSPILKKLRGDPRYAELVTRLERGVDD